MHLTPGSRLGSYEILSPLGAGGMGEVYHARDLRLERSVAIKALPHAFAADPGRLQRFEREAKLVAALNHANIAAIYGLETQGDSPYLVLEFVEGETLAQRLSRGPLPVRTVLDFGSQIASAIEAAHERGIVHRDLKPGNVMITPAGGVKVLDFGLAKGDAASSSPAHDLSASPTLAVNATGEGIILGTAPYMSPEQARGKAVDRRTDVWSFGCVLFECLSGRQAFDGETVSDVIARILEREPDWTALPASVPPRLLDVLRRCLTKDTGERPRDMGDIRRELSAIAQQASSPSGFLRAGPADLPSLAVLYFENLASDKDSEYFCSGITEDILTDLSKIKGLRVASRNAVARYRGTPVDLSRVASELGVRTVLEGSVRRSGDRVRITTQLVNAADGFQLWAERYDRTLDDVFLVQEEIASAIAGALRVALTPSETESLVQNRPNDARAYDLYLRGREQYGRYSAEAIRRALELFQEAIAIDPDYALAWAGTADCYGQMCQWGTATDPAEAVRLGLEAARRAVALNPKLAEGHKAEGLVLRFSGDLEGSRAALLRAVQANPRFTPALINLAVGEFTKANIAGTERLVRRVIEVDPQEAFATTWLALLMKTTNREDETLAAAERLRKLSNEPFYVTAAHFLRGWVHMDRGDLAAAGQAVKDGVADGADPANLQPLQAALALRAGHPDEARHLVVALEGVGSIGAGGLIVTSGTAVRLGDPDLALRFLNRKVAANLAPTLARLFPEMHPLLDREPLAPRKSDVALIWPLEAPMIDAARHRLFREVRIESGIPEGSDVPLT